MATSQFTRTSTGKSAGTSQNTDQPRCPIEIDEKGQLYIPLDNHPELRLTPWREDDLEDLIELFNQPNVGKWGNSRPFPFTREYALSNLPETESHQEYLKTLYSTISSSSPTPSVSSSSDTPQSSSNRTSNLLLRDTHPKGKYAPLGALRDTTISTEKGGKVIGSFNIRLSSRPAKEGDWEIAYYVHDDYSGRGLGSVMVKKNLELARWLGVRRIIAHAETTNRASNAILRKSGFNLHSESLHKWAYHRGGGERAGYQWDLEL